MLLLSPPFLLLSLSLSLSPLCISTLCPIPRHTPTNLSLSLTLIAMLSRCPSSLSRSPSKKVWPIQELPRRAPDDGILPCLANTRSLLPRILLAAMPFAWWYSRGSYWLPLDYTNQGFSADLFFFAMLLFFAGLVLSLALAYPYLTISHQAFSALSQNRATTPAAAAVAATVAIRKPDPNNIGGSNPAVIWTIGSGSSPMIEPTAETVQAYSNGDVYEGEFHRGRYSGSGVYYFYMSGRYEGEWVDGKYDGYGVGTWARGSHYRGQYREGLREGYGVYQFYTGDSYSGEWSKGQSHGSGTQACQDGSKYVGEFKWGVKHGYGHYFFRNGDTYAGEYFADKMHGYGIYRFANGQKYEGAWHEGKRQGLGMYTFGSGETLAGYWHEGLLQNPATQNSSIPSAVMEPKVAHIIQEAQCAAEKAYQIPSAEDSVNRAVAAANRAAKAARVAAVIAVQKKLCASTNV